MVLAGSQAPAWEPLTRKLLLGRSSGSRSFKNPIPKQELGNEQNSIQAHELFFLRCVVAPLREAKNRCTVAGPICMA